MPSHDEIGAPEAHKPGKKWIYVLSSVVWNAPAIWLLYRGFVHDSPSDSFAAWYRESIRTEKIFCAWMAFNALGALLILIAALCFDPATRNAIRGRNKHLPRENIIVAMISLILGISGACLYMYFLE